MTFISRRYYFTGFHHGEKYINKCQFFSSSWGALKTSLFEGSSSFLFLSWKLTHALWEEHHASSKFYVLFLIYLRPYFTIIKSNVWKYTNNKNIPRLSIRNGKLTKIRQNLNYDNKRDSITDYMIDLKRKLSLSICISSRKLFSCNVEQIQK